ncbi:MAG: hypothetical protein LIO46_06360 [Clostridiales bacterium]|nr:hypothetical protein [Clostridiales bacterium]
MQDKNRNYDTTDAMIPNGEELLDDIIDDGNGDGGDEGGDDGDDGDDGGEVIEPQDENVLIEINDVPLPAPTSYSIPFDDLDSSDSSRSESGVQIRNRVRAFISQINLGWRVGGTDAAKILSASRPDRVKVRFFDPSIDVNSPDYDPTQGLYSTKYMLVQSRSCSLVRFAGEQDPQGNLWDISFTLIEY